MSERWLREITDINGVEGVLLVSSGGQIIENIGTQFDLHACEGISRNILRMIASHNRTNINIKEVELAWLDYRILVMNTDAFFLIIFCNSIKSLSLLRITANVVAAHIMEDKKTMKKIKKIAGDAKAVLEENDLYESEINLISKLQ